MQKLQQRHKELNAVINRIDRLYMRFAKISGVNHYTIQILYIMAHSEIKTQKDIVDLYGLPKQTVNTIVNQLVSSGYVSLEPDLKNKRNKIISLTLAGQKHAEKLTNPLLQCEINVLQKMGDDKVLRLIQSNMEYAQYLDQEINNFQKGKIDANTTIRTF